jgi:hypothetical protein
VFTPHTAHVSCLLARAQSLPAVAPSQAGVSRFQSETEPRVLHLVVRHTQRRLHFRHRRLALHRARRPPRRCRPRGAVRSERCGRQPRAQSVARRHHPPGRCRCLQACPNALQACGRHRCAALLDAAALSTPAGSHSAASQPVGASPLSTLVNGAPRRAGGGLTSESVRCRGIHVLDTQRVDSLHPPPRTLPLIVRGGKSRGAGASTMGVRGPRGYAVRRAWAYVAL